MYWYTSKYIIFHYYWFEGILHVAQRELSKNGRDGVEIEIEIDMEIDIERERR